MTSGGFLVKIRCCYRCGRLFKVNVPVGTVISKPKCLACSRSPSYPYDWVGYVLLDDEGDYYVSESLGVDVK